jgi:hypothetical protein
MAKVNTFPGRRIEGPGDSWDEGAGPEPGDYYKKPDGWRGRTPNGHFFWLRDHHVEEHEDGTISVLPQPGNSNSIGVRKSPGGPFKWHGYIRRGVFEEC